MVKPLVAEDAQNDAISTDFGSGGHIATQYALDRAADAFHGGDTARIVVVGSKFDPLDAHVFESKL